MEFGLFIENVNNINNYIIDGTRFLRVPGGRILWHTAGMWIPSVWTGISLNCGWISPISGVISPNCGGISPTLTTISPNPFFVCRDICCSTFSTLDNIGVQLSAWNYLKPVTPVIPSYIPFDFALMPVVVMFLIQYFYNRNPWIIGLIFGVLTAFVGEPIFKLLNIYNPTNWKFIYSIPFYTLIYFLAHKLAARDKFNKLK